MITDNRQMIDIAKGGHHWPYYWLQCGKAHWSFEI